MKVRFTKNAQVEAQGKVIETFEEGKVYDLAEESARRWLRRGAAVSVGGIETAAVEPNEKAVKTGGRKKKVNKDGTDTDSTAGD